MHGWYVRMRVWVHTSALIEYDLSLGLRRSFTLISAGSSFLSHLLRRHKAIRVYFTCVCRVDVQIRCVFVIQQTRTSVLLHIRASFYEQAKAGYCSLCTGESSSVFKMTKVLLGPSLVV